MPKQETPRGDLCAVTGKILSVSGSPLANVIVTVKSEKGGVYGGAVYARLSERIRTSRLGEIEILLPPSSAVGVYTVSFLNSQYQIQVPEADRADLAELIRMGVA